jgi:hypothetical protein
MVPLESRAQANEQEFSSALGALSVPSVPSIPSVPIPPTPQIFPSFLLPFPTLRNLFRSYTPSAGAFAVAFVLVKLTGPFRLMIDVAIAPTLAAYLRNTSLAGARIRARTRAQQGGRE